MDIRDAMQEQAQATRAGNCALADQTRILRRLDKRLAKVVKLP